MGAADLRGISRIPDECGTDFGPRPRRHSPDDRRRDGRTRDERLVASRVARADGGARATAGVTNREGPRRLAGSSRKTREETPTAPDPAEQKQDAVNRRFAAD